MRLQNLDEPSHERRCDQSCVSHDFCSSSLGVLLDPILSLSIKLRLLVLVLIRNAGLNSIIRLRRRHDRADQLQHIRDLVRWLPFVAPQHAQTHRTFVVVANVRVPDLGLEVDCRWLEWVFFW